MDALFKKAISKYGDSGSDLQPAEAKEDKRAAVAESINTSGSAPSPLGMASVVMQSSPHVVLYVWDLVETAVPAPSSHPRPLIVYGYGFVHGSDL